MAENWDVSYKANKTGNGKAQKKTSAQWYAETFDIVRDYGSGKITDGTVMKAVRVRRKDDGTEHLSLEKWSVDGRLTKGFQVPTVRPVLSILFDVLKATGAIPADTAFGLTANKKAKAKPEPAAPEAQEEPEE